MDFKKAADHFRKKTTPLAVSQIVIISDQGDFAGSGKLRRNGDQIELEVTLKGNKELPMIGGIITSEQFWKIGGIIENQAPFWGGQCAARTQDTRNAFRCARRPLFIRPNSSPSTRKRQSSRGSNGSNARA